MIKTSTTAKTVSPVSDLERKAKHAAAERARRAAKKAAMAPLERTPPAPTVEDLKTPVLTVSAERVKNGVLLPEPAAPVAEVAIKPLAEHEAAIKSGAVSYTVNLFRGGGKWERAAANTAGEALEIGRKMKATYPTSVAKPIYYAVDASGASTVIKPEELLAASPPAAETAKPEAGEAPVKAKATNGLCMTAAQANAEARAAYGEAPFTVKKTARGDWYWGPIASEAPKAEKPAKPAKAAKAEKPAKAAGGSPKTGTDAQIILAYLTRPEGMTKAEIEAALLAARGRYVKISPRSTAIRFGERAKLKLTVTKDADGAERFFLAA